MNIRSLFVLLAVTSGILSALIASHIQPNLSTPLASRLGNETIIATGSNPLPRPRKAYHVPNSPITLLFFAYTAPRSLAPTVSYQTLVTALNSIYHTTVFNHGDGPISTDTVSWSYGGATVFIENHGHDRTGQLTWGMLVDTIYGVGTFLEGEACWSGEWMIEVEGLGNIGSGVIGAKVDGKVGSTLVGTTAQTA